MSTFMNLWMAWAYYFNGVPFGEYVAAFILVGVVIFLFKRMKAVMRYV